MIGSASRTTAWPGIATYLTNLPACQLLGDWQTSRKDYDGLTLHLSQACPVRVEDDSFFLTEVEKSSGFTGSVFAVLTVVDVGESPGRLGAIVDAGCWRKSASEQVSLSLAK